MKEIKRKTGIETTKLPAGVSISPFQEAVGWRKVNHFQAKRLDHRKVYHPWCIPASVPGTSGFWRTSEEDPSCQTMSKMRKLLLLREEVLKFLKDYLRLEQQISSQWFIPGSRQLEFSFKGEVTILRERRSQNSATN